MTSADMLGWVASGATAIAAMMTASNLGTRVTGWGFAVFTIGSLAWAAVGVLGGQTSLALTSLFLLLVNLFGVWRWLGRQARYEQGSAVAHARSRRRHSVPTLISGAGLVGSAVRDVNGASLGWVVDAMFDIATQKLVYAVVAQGGIGGAGEVLRAIPASRLRLAEGEVHCDLSKERFAAIPVIAEDAWPSEAPPA